MNMPNKGRADTLAISGILSIKEEQNPDHGEDDLATNWGSVATLIACFDGCGGAGAKRYDSANNKTGAYISAHISGLAADRWFKELDIAESGMRGAPADALAESLKNCIASELGRIHALLNDAGSMKGSLSKPLPTTMAAALIENQGDKSRCVALWAGDSRTFLFTVKGLRQMTADDIQGNMDAMDNLRNDGVLTNLITATGNFTIHANEALLAYPHMVITATDGCFSYFVSPIEFEGVLLQTLMASRSPNEWKKALADRIREVASDDFTMNIAIVGFQDFEDLKNAYKQRAEVFHSQYTAPLDAFKKADDRAGMARLWDQYKQFYM